MTYQMVQAPGSTPALESNEGSQVREIQITREIAQKVLTTVDAGLVSAVGQPVPGEMCVEAAVCYALGLPHGDDPICVAQSIRCLTMRLNDASWSSPQVRARGLRRLTLAQLGSKGALDECEFVERVVRVAITKLVPAALRAAASIQKDASRPDVLNEVARTCESEPNSTSCTAAERAANAVDTAADVNAVMASYGAAAAARAAASAATLANNVFGVDHAADSSAVCAECAATAAWHANASHYTKAITAYDESLAAFAENVVKILIEMKAPGCEWLDLTEAA